tara:strand:+ start:868 stop:1245 length:378 start_codon:yes stop_codon:yes gene_type:complete
LLSRVDVPTSFAAPQKTVTATTKTIGWVPLGGTPKLQFEDAKDICSEKARADGNTYMSNNAPAKRSSGSFNCYSIGIRTICRESSNAWQGAFLDAWDRSDVKKAGEALVQSVIKACMADYGWIKR